jgi:hypothetical protein
MENPVEIQREIIYFVLILYLLSSFPLTVSSPYLLPSFAQILNEVVALNPSRGTVSNT